MCDQEFYCRGRLIFGTTIKWPIVTLALITAPVAKFCYFVAWQFRHKLLFTSCNLGFTVLGIALVLTFLVLALLLITSTRDPGIVPRNSHPPEEEFSDESSASGSSRRTTPRTKVIVVNGIQVKLKYCATCLLYRPPRCSHCAICNNCIERFDHHCPWIGQCIGLRNYRHFFCFISSTTLLFFFIFASSGYYIKVLMSDNHYSFLKAIKASPASMILIAYSCLSIWFVGGLTIFHSYLISTNQTTYENFRHRSGTVLQNVYNLGCLSNYAQILCTKTPPSKIDFRSIIKEDVSATQPPHTNLESESVGSSGDIRIKVYSRDDDMPEVSQRNNIEDVGESIRNRGSNVLYNIPEEDLCEGISSCGCNVLYNSPEEEEDFKYHFRPIHVGIRQSSSGRTDGWETAGDMSLSD